MVRSIVSGATHPSVMALLIYKVVMNCGVGVDGRVTSPSNGPMDSVQVGQWDHNEILGSGPWVPDCYNGKIQSFFAESGPFPTIFLTFPDF